jgi:gluconate 5-dehydrogenase
MDGQNAIVTGGAGHLGTAISATLAELGANVVIASREKAKCQERCHEISQNVESTSTLIGEHVDVKSRKSISRLLESVHEKIGTVDVLVNNAWAGEKNTWETIDYEGWKNDIEISLDSVFMMTKAAFDDLKENGGVILNVGSMYGHVAPDYRLYEEDDTANPPSYGAAKAGVIQFTRYLASFLSPHDIRANCISPGPFPFPETQKEKPEFIDRIERRNPMGRVGVPHELKGAVALLCSDASSYMTGQNVCVDGGWTAW